MPCSFHYNGSRDDVQDERLASRALNPEHGINRINVVLLLMEKWKDWHQESDEARWLSYPRGESRRQQGLVQNLFERTEK
jgi:hypothetical protein